MDVDSRGGKNNQYWTNETEVMMCDLLMVLRGYFRGIDGTWVKKRKEPLKDVLTRSVTYVVGTLVWMLVMFKAAGLI